MNSGIETISLEINAINEMLEQLEVFVPRIGGYVSNPQ